MRIADFGSPQQTFIPKNDQEKGKTYSVLTAEDSMKLDHIVLPRIQNFSTPNFVGGDGGGGDVGGGSGGGM